MALHYTSAFFGIHCWHLLLSVSNVACTAPLSGGDLVSLYTLCMELSSYIRERRVCLCKYHPNTRQKARVNPSACQHRCLSFLLHDQQSCLTVNTQTSVTFSSIKPLFLLFKDNKPGQRSSSKQIYSYLQLLTQTPSSIHLNMKKWILPLPECLISFCFYSINFNLAVCIQITWLNI